MSQSITVLQPTRTRSAKPANQRRFETIPGLDAAPTVKTILQNKRVLYVEPDPRAAADAGSHARRPAARRNQAAQPTQIENVIIVFAGTDQDAEVIKFAQNDLSVLGSLTAVLRGAQDAAVEKTTGITIDALVDAVRPADPEHHPAALAGRNRSRASPSSEGPTA